MWTKACWEPHVAIVPGEDLVWNCPTLRVDGHLLLLQPHGHLDQSGQGSVFVLGASFDLSSLCLFCTQQDLMNTFSGNKQAPITLLQEMPVGWLSVLSGPVPGVLN